MSETRLEAHEVEVDTSAYQFAHGKPPRGRGGWAFHPNRNARADDPGIIWVNGLYGEAKRQAQQTAAERGWAFLSVLT